MITLRTAPTQATQERLQLDLFLDENSWEGFFDRVEVWRSRGTPQGPYEPLHDDSWMPARLPPRVSDVPPAPAQDGPSAVLVGKDLQFLVDEKTAINVVFAGSDPLTFRQAATQIQTQSNGVLTAFAVRNILVVQTVEAGAASILRCTGGEAAPLLGLATVEPDSLAFGRDARIVLKRGQQNYGFVDPNGSNKYFYRARFFDSFSRTVSDFSAPVWGTPLASLPLASLCRGYVDLVDMTGAPAQNQEVLLYNQFGGVQSDNKVVIGGSLKLLTDCNGHAEALLTRGACVTVALGGTTLVRDVVVPTDQTVEAVNLLATGTGTNDVFTVAVPVIDYAVRRSL